MFRLLILVALLGFGLLHVEAGNSSSESGSRSTEQIQWGTTSVTNPGGKGSNRVECDGGPLQRTELLTGLQPPCTVTANFNSDADNAILNFCANQLDTTDPASVDTADCYDLEISSTNAPSIVYKDGQIIKQTAAQPFFQKGVLTILEITINYSKCTVLNRNNGLEIPIESPNEISFRYLYVSTTTGQHSTIDAQEVPDSWGSDSGDSGSDSGNSGNDSGNSGNDSGNSGNDSGNSGSDSGNSGNDSGNSGNDSGNSGSDSGNSGNDSGKGGDSGNSGSDSGNSGSDSGNSGNDSGKGGDSGNSGSDSGNSDSGSSESGSSSREQIRWGTRSITNPGGSGSNRVECDGGPLQRTELLTGLQPPCTVTANFNSDADTAILNFCANQLDTTDPASVDTADCYDLEISSTNAPSRVYKDGQIILQTAPQPFFEKGVLTILEITINYSKCTVLNRNNDIEIPIESPNEISFRYLYVSTTTGQSSTIDAQEVPDSSGSDSSNSDSDGSNSGSDSGKSGSDSGNSGNDSGNSGNDSGNSGK
nr:dentin sialophosphoprotein-like [Lytechinus pictus]